MDCTKGTAISRVMDALDVETYLVCASEQEGRRLALQLGEELQLGDTDIVYAAFDGYGIRLRLRKYVYRPGDSYQWLPDGELR